MGKLWSSNQRGPQTYVKVMVNRSAVRVNGPKFRERLPLRLGNQSRDNFSRKSESLGAPDDVMSER